MRRPDIPNMIWFLIRLMFGLRKPRKQILGAYFAGEIEAVGKNVEQFHVGDQVFAASGPRFGAYAEYICLPTTFPIAVKPANMTHEEASAVPLGGLNALHYLRRANVQNGERVLVNGAGGSFGTFAVQLAKLMGAEVTGVDSTEKLDMLRELGADHVIDYTREEFTENGRTYDVIFNVVVKSPYSRNLRSLNEGGRYLLTNPAGISQMLRTAWTSMTSNKKVITEFARETSEELVHLRELIEAGHLRSVIDRSYPLEQAAESHRYVETERKKGNVVLTMRRQGP
jgi:NADPH:quinone reductase-like Zn-dependent oxidoreductase